MRWKISYDHYTKLDPPPSVCTLPSSFSSCSLFSFCLSKWKNDWSCWMRAVVSRAANIPIFLSFFRFFFGLLSGGRGHKIRTSMCCTQCVCAPLFAGTIRATTGHAICAWKAAFTLYGYFSGILHSPSSSTFPSFRLSSWFFTSSSLLEAGPCFFGKNVG